MFEKIKIYDDFLDEKFHTAVFNQCKKKLFYFR